MEVSKHHDKSSKASYKHVSVVYSMKKLEEIWYNCHLQSVNGTEIDPEVALLSLYLLSLYLFSLYLFYLYIYQNLETDFCFFNLCTAT